MTIYQTENPFDYNETKDWCCSSVDTDSENCVRVSKCIYECEFRFLGHDYDNYYCGRKYMHIDKNGNVEMYDVEPDGMNCMLDNFNSYYGAIIDGNYLTILSIGSSLTHRTNKNGHFNYDTMSEGFGLVIDIATNQFTLVTLGEDDGNYWGDHEIPYSSLSIYDRNEVIRIVNDIPSNKLANKDELIEKLWYGIENNN